MHAETALIVEMQMGASLPSVKANEICLKWLKREGKRKNHGEKQRKNTENTTQ